MEMKTLRDVYAHELQDVLSAEKQILKALPKLIDNAASPELQELLQDHRTVTEGQVERLEEILGSLDQKPTNGKMCKGMAGILEESEDLIEEGGSDDALLDAALISAAQKAEHYKIAAYGTLVAYAKELGDHRAMELLEQSLEEDLSVDDTLTDIATIVNADATLETSARG